MIHALFSTFACVCAAAITMLPAPVRADLLIGQTVGVTGSVAATVKESQDGAMLYIDSVNAAGGVLGEPVRLVTLDDKFDPKQAVENARMLIEERNVLALFLNRGTPHTEAIMPLLARYDIALVGPATGAMVLRHPVVRQVFNIRSSYQREAEKAVTHLHTIGLTRIAVVHVDDSFGADGLRGALNGFEHEKIQPLVVVKADRAKPDYAAIVPPLVKLDAQAVIWIGSGTAVTEGVRALRAAGSAAQVVTLSNNASTGFIKLLGDASRGVIVTQVFPNERAASNRFVSEVVEKAKARNLEVSPAVLEGYASAKVLVEALRRASPKPTRAKIIAALEKMNQFDLGGLEIRYSATDHSGLDFADLSIIGQDGRFRR